MPNGGSSAGRSPAPVLLTSTSHYGTVSAIRVFGRGGIPVTAADDRFLAPGRWSKFVTQRLRCPSVHDADDFITWLLAFGRRQPGHVLYPPSDDHAWVYAKYRDELSRDFRLYSPSFECVNTILDKKRLAGAAAKAGLATPRSWFPRNQEELAACARQGNFPLLIKPTSQVLFATHSKGVSVASPEELAGAFASFMRHNVYASEFLELHGDARFPIVQEFLPEAASRILSVSGFIDSTGTLNVMRGAFKVLQRPRRIGIGLCFEEAPLDPDLEQRVISLCRQLGYYGVFELEFIEVDGELRMIDFNPRYYGQMAFEVARAMPLPMMAYAAALGCEGNLHALIAQARDWHAGNELAYCHRAVFEVTLRAQSLAGSMSRSEEQHWRAWYERHRKGMTYAVYDEEDQMPFAVDLGNFLLSAAIHPRSFVRSMVLNR